MINPKINLLIQPKLNIISARPLVRNNYTKLCQNSNSDLDLKNLVNLLPNDKLISKGINSPKYLNEESSKLTSILSEKVLNFNEINEILKAYPKAKGRIGCLPEEWTNGILKQKSNIRLKLLQDSLGDIACKLRENNEAENIKNTSKILNNLFHDIGVLPGKDKISIKEIDKGCWGVAYLMESEGSQPFTMKVFYGTQEPNENYGNLLESNKALYWLKNAGENTQFPRFYYADLLNGFLIDKYIGKFTEPPKNIIKPESIGLQYCDMHNNPPKNGYIYDYGCLDVFKDDIVKNPNLRRMFTRLYNTPSEKRDDLIKGIVEDKNQKKYSQNLVFLNKALAFFPESKNYWLDLELNLKILASRLQFLFKSDFSKAN